MSRNREIELKLEVEQDFTASLRDHPLLRTGPAKTADQLSIYYDTPDGALRAAGFSFRVRRAGDRYVQTVKQSEGAAAGLFDRPEWEKEVGGFEPDLAEAAETPMGETLGKKLRKRLRPLIEVEARRSTWKIEQKGSRIEATLDEGDVAAGETRQTIAELELELIEGTAAALFAVARDLSGAAPLRLGVLTKAERGYRLADGSSSKAAKAEAIELRPGMTAAEGFAAIAFSCLRQFRLNEPLVVEKRDPSALHQTRVAMRRLRSGFTLFRPVIADNEYPDLRERVRWFTDQLGDARNLDVLLKRFKSAAADDRDGEALVQRLLQEREAAYDKVLEALASERLRTLMLDLAAWLETGAWRDENELSGLPLAQFANLQLDKRWKKVRRGGRNLAEVDEETRHQLRIEVKKLRYAVEFLASLATGETALARQKQFVRALEEIQESLGELNDFATARILVGELLQQAADSADMLRYANGRLEAPDSEDKQLEAAQNAHGRLVEIGPFWR